MNLKRQKLFILLIDYKEEADKLGWDYYLYKLTGGYTSYEKGIRRIS